jgi:hypothetical protein
MKPSVLFSLCFWERWKPRELREDTVSRCLHFLWLPFSGLHLSLTGAPRSFPRTLSLWCSGLPSTVFPLVPRNHLYFSQNAESAYRHYYSSSKPFSYTFKLQGKKKEHVATFLPQSKIASAPRWCLQLSRPTKLPRHLLWVRLLYLADSWMSPVLRYFLPSASTRWKPKGSFIFPESVGQTDWQSAKERLTLFTHSQILMAKDRLGSTECKHFFFRDQTCHQDLCNQQMLCVICSFPLWDGLMTTLSPSHLLGPFCLQTMEKPKGRGEMKTMHSTMPTLWRHVTFGGVARSPTKLRHPYLSTSDCYFFMLWKV